MLSGCFIVSGLSQNSLRLSLCFTKVLKNSTVLFPIIADHLKKLNHIQNPRQIDSGRLYEDHSGEWQTPILYKLLFICHQNGYYGDGYYPNETGIAQLTSILNLIKLSFLFISVAEDVPTEILRYDLGSKKYQQLQLLPTKGASDLCFLEIGTGLNTLHFLVVVNRVAFGMTFAIYMKCVRKI